jgi:hypothetical protein
MQIWLILAVVGTAPIHVGNFPDMDTCQAEAMSSRGQVTGARPGTMSYLWMCVQANTGKPNDPPLPRGQIAEPRAMPASAERGCGDCRPNEGPAI